MKESAQVSKLPSGRDENRVACSKPRWLYKASALVGLLHFCTDTRGWAFIQRLIRLWNPQSQNVGRANSMHGFKRKLDNFMKVMSINDHEPLWLDQWNLYVYGDDESLNSSCYEGLATLGEGICLHSLHKTWSNGIGNSHHRMLDCGVSISWLWKPIRIVILSLHLFSKCVKTFLDHVKKYAMCICLYMSGTVPQGCCMRQCWQHTLLLATWHPCILSMEASCTWPETQNRPGSCACVLYVTNAGSNIRGIWSPLPCPCMCWTHTWGLENTAHRDCVKCPTDNEEREILTNTFHWGNGCISISQSHN